MLQKTEEKQDKEKSEKPDRSSNRREERRDRDREDRERRRDRGERDRDRPPKESSRKDRDRYEPRTVEDEEDAYERRRLDRKLREKESSYQERLKNWEIREARKTKEYEREISKENQRRDDEQKEERRLKQFMEDYDDDRDDTKYYKGSALSRRLRERQKEMEEDDRDRRLEKRELEDLRRKLIDEGHPDPDSEARKLLNSGDGVERERDRIVSAKIKELRNDVKVKGAVVNEDSMSANSDSLPLEEIHVKSFSFTGLKLGNQNQGNGEVISPNIDLKRKKISVQDIFNANEDDEQLLAAKRRKLPTLADDTDSNQSLLSNTAKSGDSKSLTSEEKRKQIKILIEGIPTSKEELFKYAIEWTLVDNVSIVHVWSIFNDFCSHLWINVSGHGLTRRSLSTLVKKKKY